MQDPHHLMIPPADPPQEPTVSHADHGHYPSDTIGTSHNNDYAHIASDTPGARFEALLAVMAQLRNPVGGCPWDLEQNFATIAPYTIEEAYEVADAIARDDMRNLCEELGDLILQPVFHAQMASEAGTFTINDVLDGIIAKMIHRHPHVFGDVAGADTATAIDNWEILKAQEKAARGQTKTVSVLDDVPLALPALVRSQKLSKRAAKLGFDWPDAQSVFAKIDEELAELKAAVAKGQADHIAEELGDLLHVMGTLARKLDVDAEDALRGANVKFVRRFAFVEAAHASGARTLDALEAAWTEAKAAESKG